MKKRYRALLLALAVVALSAACVVLRESGILQEVRSVDDLRALIDRAGPWAGVVFFLLQMLTVIIAPIPSNVTMMAGALALGFTEALVLGVLGIVAGSVVIFLAARGIGRKAVQRWLSSSVLEKYLPLIEEKQDMFLFLTMLFPFFPDDALCILAGLTRISTVRFIVIMALARPWGLVFAALLGSGALRLPVWGWIVLTIVLAAVFVLAMKYSREIEDALLRAFDRIHARFTRKGGRK